MLYLQGELALAIQALGDLGNHSYRVIRSRLYASAF
jgi:hypothetical protein